VAASPNKLAGGLTARRASRAAAGERFTQALVAIAAQGLRTDCSDAGSHLWISENAADRAEAAKLCQGCPVQLDCWEVAAARGERFGVWGGVDFTVPQGTAAP
jgi:hypothetical protein